MCHIHSDISVTSDPFTVTEIEVLCRGLKCKIAGGWDQITPEHLKYCGQRVLNVVTDLFNVLLSTEIYPKHFKKGVIFPIPKDPIMKDNN